MNKQNTLRLNFSIQKKVPAGLKESNCGRPSVQPIRQINIVCPVAVPFRVADIPARKLSPQPLEQRKSWAKEGRRDRRGESLPQLEVQDTPRIPAQEERNAKFKRVPMKTRKNRVDKKRRTVTTAQIPKCNVFSSVSEIKEAFPPPTSSWAKTSPFSPLCHRVHQQGLGPSPKDKHLHQDGGPWSPPCVLWGENTIRPQSKAF